MTYANHIDIEGLAATEVSNLALLLNLKLLKKLIDEKCFTSCPLPFYCTAVF